MNKRLIAAALVGVLLAAFAAQAGEIEQKQNPCSPSEAQADEIRCALAVASTGVAEAAQREIGLRAHIEMAKASLMAEREKARELAEWWAAYVKGLTPSDAAK